MSPPRDSDRQSRLRTDLANERTLLAYIRTALGFLATGMAALGFGNSGFSPVIGWGFIGTGILLLFVGAVRFFQTRHVVGDDGDE